MKAEFILKALKKSLGSLPPNFIVDDTWESIEFPEGHTKPTKSEFEAKYQEVENEEQIPTTSIIDTKFEVGTANLFVDTITSNVGVGTKTPAYKLDVDGDINLTGDLYQDGSLFVSSEWTTGDTSLFYRSNVEVGTANLFVDTVTSNVGIGTSSPSYKLDVDGDINLTGDLYQDGSLFVSSEWTTGASSLYYRSNVEVGTADLFVDTVTSNVGIGTSTPAYKLDVAGDINLTGDLYQGGSPFVSSEWTTGASSLYYRSNVEVGTADLFVDTVTSNVGIGTSTPAYKLDVRGTSNVGALTATTVTVPNDGNFVMNSKPLTPATGLHWDRVNSRLGVGTSSPATKLHVAGGTIINSDGVAKKTYSYSGDLGAGQTIANSTIKITFSQHVFYAKIVAHLVEFDAEVSTLSLECGGGHWSGGTPLAIAKGPQAIFGSASTNPWDSTVTTTTTTVSFKPTTDMAEAGHYNVFIEYISQSSSGTVSKITEGSTDVVTFAY